MESTERLFVSVIIPVYNDAERLKICLQALEEQSYPKELYEVIVIDNGSDKSIDPIVAQFSQAVADSETTQQGPAFARNKGLSLAQGDLIAFTDSDCIPAQDWIERGVATLQSRPNCGIIGGKIEMFFQNPIDPTAVEFYDRILYLDQQRYIERLHFSATANLFTYKHVFDHVGKFSENVAMSDDREWGQRVKALGYQLVYADTVRVKHPARFSLAQLLAKERRVTQDLAIYKDRREDFPPVTGDYGNIIDRLIPTLPYLTKGLRLNNGSIWLKFKVVVIWFMVRFIKLGEILRIKLFKKT